jgi:uncharacterized protein YhaN
MDITVYDLIEQWREDARMLAVEVAVLNAKADQLESALLTEESEIDRAEEWQEELAADLARYDDQESDVNDWRGQN